MISLRYIRSQAVLCLVWLVLVLAVFLACTGTDISLLWNADADRKLPAIAEDLARSNQGVPVMELTPMEAEEPPASAPPPVVSDGPPALGPAHVLLAKDVFRVQFTLNQLVQGEIKVLFQKKPAAWMIDLPGNWVRTGREEVVFDHHVVRKLRITPGKERTRLKFYYTGTATRGSKQPVVALDGTSLKIQIENP